MTDTYRKTADVGAVYSNLVERGNRDRVLDNPVATDEQLWTLASDIQPDVFAPWGEVQGAADEDPGLLAGIGEQLERLREQYDDGRRPDKFDLHMVAKALSDIGIDAEVSPDCGGQWLLHAGPQFPDAEGVRRYAVNLGGETFQGAFREVWCVVEGASVGTADPDVPEAEKVGEQLVDDRAYRAAEIAELVSKVLDEELERRGYDSKAWAEHGKALDKRIAAAVAVAERAFWDSIAEMFPEVTGGDLDPGAALATERRMRSAVTSWIEENETPTVPWAAGTAAPRCGGCGRDGCSTCYLRTFEGTSMVVEVYGEPGNS